MVEQFLLSAILIPSVISQVVAGWQGRMIFNASYGPLNDILARLGIKGPAWLASQQTALPTIFLTDTWQWTPFLALIILAALQSMPQDIVEAARLDGAYGWSMFRFVTVPLILPVTGIGILLRGVDLFKTFDLVYILTQGGPGNSSETLTYFTYVQGFKFFNPSYASAMSFIQLILVTIAAKLFLSFIRRQAELLRCQNASFWIFLKWGSPDRLCGALPFSLLLDRLQQFERAWRILYPSAGLVPGASGLVELSGFPPARSAEGFDGQFYHRFFVDDISLLLGAPAAYAIARFQVGRENLAFWILSIRMFPPIATILPLFVIFRFVGLVDSYAGLVLSYTVFNLPFAIWILKGFIEDLPREIEEAAKVDGARPFQIFRTDRYSIGRSGSCRGGSFHLYFRLE